MLKILKSAKIDVPFWVIILCFIALNILWFRQDTAPPLWDQVAFLHTSEVLFQTLTREGFIPFLDAFTEALKIKPPLISVFPIPFYFLFGSEHQSALYVNLLFLAVASYYMLKLGTLVSGRTEALVGVVILNTFPLVFAMSREFLAELGLMMFVIMWMYYLLQSRGFEGRRESFSLGIILGAGMLMKVSFVFYILIPSLYLILKKTVEMRKFPAHLFSNIVLVIFIGTGIASVWYLKNLFSVIEFSFSSGYGTLAENYAMGDIFSIKTIVAYWVRLINYGISTYYFLLIATLLIAAMIIRLKTGGLYQMKPRSFWLLIVWIVVPFVLFSLGTNKDYRYIIPICPAIALLIGTGIVRIASRRLFVIAVLLIFPFLHYINASFDLWPLHIKVKDFIIFSNHLGYAHPPIRENWQNERFVRYINNDTVQSYIRQAQATLLFDHPYFNATISNYYARKNDYSILFNTNDFYRNESRQETIARVENESDYIIVKSGKIGPEFVNVKNVFVIEKLRKEGMPFEQIKTMDLPDDTYLTILRRRHPRVYQNMNAIENFAMRKDRKINFSSAVSLLDYEFQKTQDRYRLILFWECLDRMDKNYKVFVHVYNAENMPIYNADHYPHPRYKTSLWRKGEVIRDEVTLPSGLLVPFHIYVGLYDETTLEKMPVAGKPLDDPENIMGVKIHSEKK